MESPVFAFPLLLKIEPHIEQLFTYSFSWNFECSHCGHKYQNRLVFLFSLMDSFCWKCLQVMKYEENLLPLVALLSLPLIKFPFVYWSFSTAKRKKLSPRNFIIYLLFHTKRVPKIIIIINKHEWFDRLLEGILLRSSLVGSGG